MGRVNTNSRIRKTAFMGLLFATAMVLSFLESMLPVLPMMPPGVKLGLSNIVTMYALFSMGPASGITIALLKSLFVFSIRGPLTAAISLAGGALSVLCMLAISRLPGIRRNYLVLSIFGSIGHNIGQLLMYRLISGTAKIFYLVPVMILSGIVMGVVTGLILRAVMPYVNKLKLNL